MVTAVVGLWLGLVVLGLYAAWIAYGLCRAVIALADRKPWRPPRP